MKIIFDKLTDAGYNSAFTNSVLNIITSNISWGENPLQLLEAKWKNNLIFLIATDHGIFYISYGSGQDAQLTKLPYLNILSAHAYQGPEGRTDILIRTAGININISCSGKSEIRKFVRLIKKFSEEKRSASLLPAQQK